MGTSGLKIGVVGTRIGRVLDPSYHRPSLATFDDGAHLEVILVVGELPMSGSGVVLSGTS
jgi:hypothetical protein